MLEKYQKRHRFVSHWVLRAANLLYLHMIVDIVWRARMALNWDITKFDAQKHKKLHFLVKLAEAEKNPLQKQSEYLKMAQMRHEPIARVCPKLR